MTKPSPIPLEFIYSVFYKNPKSLNNLSWSYSSIPTPESSTEIYNIQILKNNHPNYERINRMIGFDDKGKIRKRPVQICTNNNPFD